MNINKLARDFSEALATDVARFEGKVDDLKAHIKSLAEWHFKSFLTKVDKAIPENVTFEQHPAPTPAKEVSAPEAEEEEVG